MATNTLMNVGLRLPCGTLGLRNFEDSGTVQYKSNYQSNTVGLYFNGTNFTVGQSITFDVGGTSYSVAAIALLRRYWDQGWILPVA